MSPTKKSAIKSSTGFSDAERVAMKERAQELKAKARWKKDKAAGESDVLTKISEMRGADRAMAKRLHEIIKATAEKFKSRYATFGFNDVANLDEGAMWQTSFALKNLTADEEAEIGALVKRAVS